jgi:hypothetical protein
MTSDEFNEKWKVYLRERGVGLQIDDDRVLKYLNEEFSKEINSNPLFIFGQIKIKFETTRIYANSSKKTEWEKAIDQILTE